MAGPDDVMHQLQNPNDRIKVYDGAGKSDGISWAQLPDAGWWAWDLRGWIRQITWDLLRFQRPSAFSKGGGLDGKWGMRDQITRTHYLVEKIAEKLDIK